MRRSKSQFTHFLTCIYFCSNTVVSFLPSSIVLHSTSTARQDKLVASSNVFSQSVEPTVVAEEDRVGAWVPVGSASSLQGLDPTKIEIMGRNFVVWQGRTDSGESQWNVALDECPHRFAPLSQGRIDPDTKCLECPYHGWQFHSGNGTVAKIPQADYDIGPTAERALGLTSYPTHQTGDLIWTFLPTEVHGEFWPMSMLPEDYYDGLKDYVDRGAPFDVVELPYSYDFLVENGLDSAHHATFSHHKVGFDRKDATPLPVTVPIFNFTHITIELKYVRKGKERLRRYGLQRPFMVTNQQLVDGEWKPVIIFMGVPIREGRSRILTTLDTFAPVKGTPDWILHWINRKFFEGDVWMHETEHAIRSNVNQSDVPSYKHATKSDRSTLAFRSWWSKYGLRNAPSHTFGAAAPENLVRLPRREQIDPWIIHTKSCSKCRTVVERARWSQNLGLVVAVCGGLSFQVGGGQVRMVATTTAMVGGMLVNAISRKIVRELAGTPYHYEIQDRSLSHSD